MWWPKINDPYLDDDDELSVNIFAASNQDYVYEVETCKTLPDFQGSAIPRYHGSYSLEIPVDLERKRCIHVT